MSTEPFDSFSCWFWDFDNDGRLDLFVTGFSATLSDVVANMIGQPGVGDALGFIATSGRRDSRIWPGRSGWTA